MNPVPTDAFPYTTTHLTDILGIEESKLLALCGTLDIQPYRHPQSGRLFFDTKALETLQRALDAEKQHETRLPQRTASALMPGASGTAVSKSDYGSVPQRASASAGLTTASAAAISRSDLSIIVDSVSNAKETILRDLSQLLDDKLAGLDDVVVELIRSKSENDSLREELRRLEEDRMHYQAELAKFKPAAFGFYRKEN